MKTKYILCLLGVSLISLTSCKKDWNCNCSASIITIEAENYENITKSDAESRCSDTQDDLRSAFNNNEISCSISER